MTDNHRAPETNKNDLRIAIHVKEYETLSFPEKPRRHSHGSPSPHRAADAARDDFLGLRK